MRILILLLVFICSASCARYAPAAPPNSPPTATKPAEAKLENRAVLPCSYVAQNLDAQAKCLPSSGRGTQLAEEVDAVLCYGTKWLMHCDVPDNSEPKITIVAQWGEAPNPEVAPAASSPPPTPAKDAPKKK